MAGNIPTPFIPVAKVPGVGDIGAGCNRSRQDCWIAYFCRAVIAGRQPEMGSSTMLTTVEALSEFDRVGGRDHGRVGARSG